MRKSNALSTQRRSAGFQPARNKQAGCLRYTIGRGWWLCALVLTCGAGAAAAEPNSYVLESRAFRAATEKVLPSVVTIETAGGALRPVEKAAPAKAARRGPPRRRGASGGISRPGDGPTTGLIISPDGYIVTSTYNFAREQPIIVVSLHDGTQHVAKLLGQDETRKLCLLKIDEVTDLAVPSCVPRSELKVGQWAISVGCGFGGDEPAISAGVISAVSRIFGKAVQTDANLSPANYGGPLIDIEGRVIGICVPLSPRAQGPTSGAEWYDSGIGFAIPLYGAEALIERLKKGEVVHAGWLGIQPAPAAGSADGVVISKVNTGSPAEKAGLKEKDVILSVNGEATADVLALRTLLGRFAAGDSVSLRIKRDTHEMELQVQLAASPAGAPPEDQEPRKVEP